VGSLGSAALGFLPLGVGPCPSAASGVFNDDSILDIEDDVGYKKKNIYTKKWYEPTIFSFFPGPYPVVVHIYIYIYTYISY